MVTPLLSTTNPTAIAGALALVFGLPIGGMIAMFWTRRYLWFRGAPDPIRSAAGNLVLLSCVWIYLLTRRCMGDGFWGLDLVATLALVFVSPLVAGFHFVRLGSVQFGNSLIQKRLTALCSLHLVGVAIFLWVMISRVAAQHPRGSLP